MPPAPPRAIVFDLDGTLVETAPDLHLVLDEVMAEEGLAAPPLVELRTMIGDGAKVLLQRGFAAAGVDLGGADLERRYARFLDRYVAEPCRASTLYDGVRETLTVLRDAGVMMSVCTNKPQRPSELLMEALGIDGFFTAVVGGDVLPVRKPDGGHLRAALEPLGAGPDAAWMVGDSRNDLLTARALDMRCALMTYGYTAVPAADLGADLVLDRFADVPGALGLTPPEAPRT